MLKAELHIHTGDDPLDAIPYSTEQLVIRASELGYQTLAITLHNRQLDLRPFLGLARERGITLIPGVERTIRGKHVLLLNFPEEAERAKTLDEVARLKRRWPGLVIAPHPFYPMPCCLGRTLERYAPVFDAVEYNAFYTTGTNWFNGLACSWARRHGKPLVANSDVHRLEQFGRTCTLVDAEPDPTEICSALRAGRVEIRTAPISLLTAATQFLSLSAGGLAGRLRSRRPLVGGEVIGEPIASR